MPVTFSHGHGTSPQPWNPNPPAQRFSGSHMHKAPAGMFPQTPEPELPPVDSHTIFAAQLGNPQASTHILRSYHECIYRFLWQMTHQELGDRITEDLCQETFARFFLALRNEANPLMRPIKNWLLEIARMVAVRHIRQHQQRLQTPRYPAPEPQGPIHETQSWIAFADAMQEISPAHREILYLRQEQGLSYVEIARALGVCVGTVKSRLSRSRKALERAMQRKQSGPHRG